MTCDLGTHTCGCKKPDSANLIRTPGFNTATSTASDWDTFATWDLSDADGCSGSGSAKLSTQIKQCVTVPPASAYFFGFKYKQTTDGNVACQLGYFFNSDCTYQLPTPGGTLLDNIDTGPATNNQWTQLAVTLNPATNTHSIQVYCFSVDPMGGSGWLDQIYLSLTHNGF